MASSYALKGVFFLMLVIQGGGFILWFEGCGAGLWLQVVGQTVKMRA